jgi:hypothetical protein
MTFYRNKLPDIYSKNKKFSNFAIYVNQFFNNLVKNNNKAHLLVFNANRFNSFQANSFEELKIIYKKNPLTLNNNDVDKEMLQEVKNFYKIFNIQECFVDLLSDSTSISKALVFFMNCAYRDYIEQDKESRLYYFVFLKDNGHNDDKIVFGSCNHSCDFMNTL